LYEVAFQEQIETLQTQIKTTAENLNYLDKLFKADRLRYASLLTMEAGNERLQSELQNAEVELQVSKTKLNRLINNTSEVQSIEMLPARYTFSTEQIVAAAYGQLPEMKAFGFYRKQKQEEENLLYVQRLPVVSAFSNIGTTYSSAAKEIVENELRTMRYFDQFGNNLNMNVGLGVSIPIFNSINYRQKLQRNAIEQKIIWHQENDRKQEIKSIVEESASRINGLVTQYEMSKGRIEQLEKLVQINRRSFEEGRGEFTEFLQARRDMEQAQAQQNRLRYQYLVYLKQLEFYRKGTWE
jgi:outer membrane protein